MRILKTVNDTVHNLISDDPSEIGGILGSHNNELIDEVILDAQDPNALKRCSYTPNVAFLNQQIKHWQDCKIHFKGMFHTHHFGIKTLSCGDQKYITEIMTRMPDCIQYLYFPIFVLPDRQWIGYKAVRTNEEILIQEDDIFIEQ